MASNEITLTPQEQDFKQFSELLGKMNEQEAARAINIACRSNPFLYQQLKNVLPL